MTPSEHIRHGEQMPTMHSTMHLYPIDGAVHRVGSKDTPFAYRDVNWAEVIVGVDPDPANNDRTIPGPSGIGRRCIPIPRAARM